MTSNVDVKVDDGIAWLTLRRPEVRNAVDARLVDAAPTRSFDEHLHAEEAAITSLWNSADVAEGVAAFVERRRPKFQGR